MREPGTTIQTSHCGKHGQLNAAALTELPQLQPPPQPGEQAAGAGSTVQSRDPRAIWLFVRAKMAVVPEQPYNGSVPPLGLNSPPASYEQDDRVALSGEVGCLRISPSQRAPVSAAPERSVPTLAAALDRRRRTVSCSHPQPPGQRSPVHTGSGVRALP